MNIIQAFTSVWTAIVTFLVSLFGQVTSLFWDASANSGAGEPTFVGVLAIVMAGVSLILLVFNLIRSFFSMRG